MVTSSCVRVFYQHFQGIQRNLISDMTVKELRKLIRDVVQEVIDPDYGLELRPEVEAELKASLKRKEKGIPLESDAPFNTRGIARFKPALCFCAMGIDLQWQFMNCRYVVKSRRSPNLTCQIRFQLPPQLLSIFYDVFLNLRGWRLA